MATIKRGGNHPVLGNYLGGSDLNHEYKLVKKNSYKYTSQLRTVKQLSVNEGKLREERNSISTMKFDGKLELPESAGSTEMDKEQFFQGVQENINFYGLQTFFFLPDSSNEMRNLVKNTHLFTLEDVINEHDSRLTEPPAIVDSNGTETDESVLARHRAYDCYELYDMALSRLAIEALLTARLREEIRTRFSHVADFEDLPGNIYFMMILETCNISVSMDVKGAQDDLTTLELSSFAGENVSAFAILALKLIKIMSNAYSLPLRTGSDILRKVTKTSSEYFNRTMFTHLDVAYRMEDKYALKDPALLRQDPLYPKYGPIGICGILQEEYSRLYKAKDWPALSCDQVKEELQSNFTNVTTGKMAAPKREKTKRHEHGPEPDRSTTTSSPTSIPTSSKSSTNNETSPAERHPWKYVHPANENQIMDIDGKTWKFCKHCVCRHTKKKGFYNLSHTTSQHIDNYKNVKVNSSGPSINMLSSLDAPTVRTSNTTSIDEFHDTVDSIDSIPPSPTRQSTNHSSVTLTSDPSDELIFSGVWLSPILNQSEPQIVHVATNDTTIDSTTSVSIDENFSTILEEENGSKYPKYQDTFFKTCNVAPSEEKTYEANNCTLSLLEKISFKTSDDMFETTFNNQLVNENKLIFNNEFFDASDESDIENDQFFDVCEEINDHDSSSTSNVNHPSFNNLWNLILFAGRLFPSYFIFEYLDVLLSCINFQWFQFVPVLFGVNLVFWDSIFIYFEPIGQLPRKMRRTRTNTYSIFPRRWMILTGALMALQFGSCKHPCVLMLENLQSTFIRSNIISNYVNLSPITLTTYNLQQFIKLQHLFIETPTNFSKNKSSYHHVQQNSSSSSIDFLPFASGSTNKTFEVNCNHLQDNKFDPAINYCPIPKIYNILANGNIGPNFMDPITSKEFPILFDSGASVAISGFKEDFIADLNRPKTDIRLGGMANGMLVEGIGKVKWSLKSDSNNVVIHTQCYYVPNAKVRLISPQRLFNKESGVGGSFNIYEEYSTLLFDGLPSVRIDYDEKSFLPVAYARNAEFSFESNLSIMDGGNQNLTPSQKLLLQWHYRFGHKGFRLIQHLFRHLPFGSEKFMAAANCDVPKCSICEFSKAHRTSTKGKICSSNPSTDGNCKNGYLRPGSGVSVDHFESRLKGRTYTSFGKSTSDKYIGGCIFVDLASGYIHVKHQLGFSSSETIRAKQNFEKFAFDHNVIIEDYLADNGVFKAKAFIRHLRDQNQRVKFCGVNAHHQNGVAERGVRTISEIARCLLLHASTHWKNGIDSSLWPMAVDYATYLHNHIPNQHGIAPVDLFFGSQVPKHKLRDLHVWGCPVYVLDPTLQQGKKLPRWEPRSRRGLFVGFSPHHSSNVPLILNLSTGSISPQFHVVFDDQFSSVESMVIDEQPPSFWNEFDLDSHTTQIPLDRDSNATLSSEWLNASDLEERSRSFARSNEIRRKFNPSSSTNAVFDHPTTTSQASRPLEELITREPRESPQRESTHNQPLEERSIALEEKPKVSDIQKVLPSTSSQILPSTLTPPAPSNGLTSNSSSSSQVSSRLSSPTNTSLRRSTRANKGI